MGILNVTPDSFYDGNIHYNKNLSNIFKKLNKCDIIEKLGVFKLIDNNNILEFLTFDDMKKHIVKRLKDIIKPKKIIFSGNKDGI